MLLLVFDADAWRALSAKERDATHRRIGAWFGRLNASGLARGTGKLEAARAGMTLRRSGDEELVTSGPFNGSTEVIRAFAVVDVPVLEAALALAKSWPDPNAIVEVRPVSLSQGGLS